MENIQITNILLEGENKANEQRLPTNQYDTTSKPEIMKQLKKELIIEKNSFDYSIETIIS